MSRTYNTRPWEIQKRDLKKAGYTLHVCTPQTGLGAKRNHKAPKYLQFIVSNDAWEAHQHLMGEFSYSMTLKWDNEVHLSIKKGRNTTTAKLTQQLCAIFGTVELRTEKWPSTRVIMPCSDDLCTRVLYYYGGERHLGGNLSAECHFRRRRTRAREREALHRVRTGADEDFDLPPIREDKSTIFFDLT
jgi:hypothetical protein